MRRPPKRSRVQKINALRGLIAGTESIQSVAKQTGIPEPIIDMYFMNGDGPVTSNRTGMTMSRAEFDAMCKAQDDKRKNGNGPITRIIIE